MKSVIATLSARMQAALTALGVDADPRLAVAQDERFGNYQSNCAMGLAKQLKRKPREVAEELCSKLKVSDICEPPQIAGPGFINFRIKPGFLGELLGAIEACAEPAQDRLGIEPADTPQTVVVDLSSPNLAKQMHVGHVRSAVIGDCICRALEFAGHRVYRENHVGDWGTQFGMLVAHLRHARPEVVESPEHLVISDLEAFYVEAKAHFDRDEEFAREARETVVALQAGDPQTRRIWRAFCDESLRHCHQIHDRLGVKAEDRGESYYADEMLDVIRRLEASQDERVRESDGALCIFPDGFQAREGEPLPLIVRKRDGGFNYVTSDLAALIHRVEQLKADHIIYVVGVAQTQHLAMIFEAVREFGWAPPEVALTHVAFGNMLAADGRPFKTREGGTVKLKDLLDEAVARARMVVTEQLAEERSTRELTCAEVERIAEVVGLAAVKYFDLSHALKTDYKFDLNTMLSLEGNTAPYLLYAYARVQAIGRKGGIDFATLPTGVPLVLEHQAEQKLALVLARFRETLDTVLRELTPITLTEYLYTLAKAFSRFYDKKVGVRVLDAEPETVRHSRLRLCDLTARTLRLGLHLLGIETLEQM